MLLPTLLDLSDSYLTFYFAADSAGKRALNRSGSAQSDAKWALLRGRVDHLSVSRDFGSTAAVPRLPGANMRSKPAAFAFGRSALGGWVGMTALSPAAGSSWLSLRDANPRSVVALNGWPVPSSYQPLRFGVDELAVLEVMLPQKAFLLAAAGWYLIFPCRRA
jgi:hypothetical protein